MNHRNLLILVVASVLATGCVSYEGVGVVPPNPGSMELQAYGTLERIERNSQEEQVHGLIVIGTTSALRTFGERSSARAYDKYSKYVADWEAGLSPTITYEEFASTIFGYTKLRIWRVIGVASGYQTALVPHELLEKIEFASKAKTILWQAAEDLVAAETNDDGVFIVKAVLCDRDSEFSSCQRRFKSGLYDKKIWRPSQRSAQAENTNNQN